MLATLLALALPCTAGEVELITSSVFGVLSQTVTFDVNRDAHVSAADLTALVEVGEPRSVGCSGPVATGGRQSMQVGADLRDYEIVLPPDYDGVTPRPVVFGFHGFTGNGAVQKFFTRLPTYWPEAIGVYPDGLVRTIVGFPAPGKGWQLFPGEMDDRDVAFFDALVEQLSAQYCINPERIYASGHSNGAFFSHVLGCERGDQLAAIAAMAGGLLDCSSDTQVAAIMSHGTGDMTVPFLVGVESRATWAARDDCSAAVVPYGQGCDINIDCAPGDDVAFCQFAGDHLPDPNFPSNMLRFFKEHARRE